MGGALQLLFFIEKLFMHFFTRTKTGINNFDIPARLQTRQHDHFFGKFAYQYGLTHIQHQYFSALTDGAGLQDKAGRFGNGHEEAGDIRMGDSHRATGCYLTFE